MFIRRIKRWFRRPTDPSGYVYYVRLRTPQGVFYKLGYTRKPTLEERLAYGGVGDEKLIDRKLLFSFQPDAWDIEQLLLEHFEKHRVFGKHGNDPSMPLAGRGQSELFDRDILGLDEELYKPVDIASSSMTTGTSLDERGEGCLLMLIGIVLIPFTLGLSLFFIVAGLSGIHGPSSSRQSETKQGDLRRAPRPLHPPEIKKWIDKLRAPAE